MILGVAAWFRVHNAVNHHVFWHRAWLIPSVETCVGLVPLDSDGDLVTSISLLCLNESLLDTFNLIDHFILTINSLHAVA